MFDLGAVQSLICGSAAGVCAKVAVYPMDLVKKRLQIQGFEHGRVGFGDSRLYGGIVDCLRKVAYEERLKGIYKGLWPSLLKAAASTGLHFFVYEQSCNLLKQYNSQR